MSVLEMPKRGVNIALRERRAFAHAKGEAILQRVETYWRSMYREGVLPRREDIQSYEIDDVLAHCFVAERKADGDMILRVAGRHLHEICQRDLKGEPLAEAFVSQDKGAAADLLESVFQSPELLELELKTQKTFAKPVVTARLLCLPLRAEQSSVTRIFGAFVSDRAPSALRRDAFGVFEGSVIRCQQCASAPVNQSSMLAVSSPRVADVSTAQVVQPKQASQSHLRLVVNNI